jgi:hypothetical protein
MVREFGWSLSRFRPAVPQSQAFAVAPPNRDLRRYAVEDPTRSATRLACINQGYSQARDEARADVFDYIERFYNAK